MRKTVGGALLAFAFVFGIIATTSTSAEAQWRNRGYDNQQIQQGYHQGVNTGASDAQRRQSYSPERSRHYRNAPSQAFRQGFVRGYEQGYRQYSRSNGGYRNDGYYGNGGYRHDDDYEDDDYRHDDYYGNRRNRDDGYYGNGGYNNQELNRGYRQGVNTGASDGQRGQSYDPQRSRHFRNASSQAFRDGFVQGYDEGYRQYSRNRNQRRGNTGVRILEQIFGRP